jgi:hypothetical protein
LGASTSIPPQIEREERIPQVLRWRFARALKIEIR